MAAKNKENDPKGTCAEDDPAHKYFFIIDEINRADLSNVLGELMFCLESDKRGEAVFTQYRNLPTYGLDGKDVFANGFFVPNNVYIIGTMNDIDRSVESIDFALRRRFVFLEVEVEYELLADAFQAKDRNGSAVFGSLLYNNAEETARRIMALNGIIAKEGEQFGLNRQYYISQGQFSGLPEDRKSGTDLNKLLAFVWDFRLKSLLGEYVRGEDSRKVEPFLAACQKAFMGNGWTEESAS